MSMRFLLALLVACVQPSLTWAVTLKGAQGYYAAAASVPVTEPLPAEADAGDVIFVLSSVRSNSIGPTGCFVGTDTTGPAFTSVVSSSSSGTAGQTLYEYVVPSGTTYTTSNSITCRWSGASGNKWFGVLVFSGLSTAIPGNLNDAGYAVPNPASNCSSTTPCTTIAVGPVPKGGGSLSSPGDLLIAALTTVGTGFTNEAGTSPVWNAPAVLQNTSGDFVYVAWAIAPSSAGATWSPTLSGSATTNPWSGLIAAFVPAGYVKASHCNLSLMGAC